MGKQNYEGGHVKNVANAKEAVLRYTYLGTRYNPTNPDLSVASMNALIAQAEAVLDALGISEPLLDLRLKERAAAFRPLNRRVTRMVNVYEASGNDPLLLTKLRTLANDIKGIRATPKPQPVVNPDGSVTEPNTISTAQTSFDLKLANFDKFIKTLQTDTAFEANEADLKKAALLAMHAGMESANTAVNVAQPAVDNDRIERDRVLYAEPGGLVPVMLRSKVYAKGAFGSDSPEYKQVSGIEFRRADKRR